MKKTTVLIIFLLTLPIIYGLTPSIGNEHMVIHTEVGEGITTVIEKYIKVNNVNDVPVKINLEPTGDLIDIIELLDKNFTLQPNESKEANFMIRLDNSGTYQGQIGVGFTTLEGSNGVGLSSTIIIIANGPEAEIPEEIEEEEIPEGGVEEEIKEIEEEEKVTGKKKANLLIGLLLIIIVVGVGVILFLVTTLLLRKK